MFLGRFLKRRLLAATLACALLGLCAATAAADPSITIDSPAESAVLTNAALLVSFNVSDAPGASVTCWIGSTQTENCTSPWKPHWVGNGEQLISLIVMVGGEPVAGAYRTIVIDDSSLPPDTPDEGGGSGEDPNGNGGQQGSDGSRGEAGDPGLRVFLAPKSVKLGKVINLGVECPVACSLKLSMKIGRKRVKGLKSVKLGSGVRGVSLRLPKKVVAQVRKARRKSRKTKVTLTITPTSAAGNGAAKKVAIR